MSEPRDIWVDKEDVEPSEYNALLLKPDADKIDNFVHFREVMSDDPMLVPATDMGFWGKAAARKTRECDRLTLALEKAKKELKEIGEASGPVEKRWVKEALEKIEVIEKGNI